MSKMQFLFVVALYVGTVHSWDLATSTGNDEIDFYKNFTLTRTETIPSRNIFALKYDEVHNMMLYIDKKTNHDSICGYDLTCKENKCFTQGSGRHIHDIAFDPVTEQVFFTDTKARSVNVISIKLGSKNSAKVLIKMDTGIPRDIVVDSCDGYIYWHNTNMRIPTIERARLNGNGREVFENLTTINVNATFKFEPSSLAIDQPTRCLYWLEPASKIEYRLFTSSLTKNRTAKKSVIYKIVPRFKEPANAMTISNIAVIFLGLSRRSIQSYSKKLNVVEQKMRFLDKEMPISVVAKYEIKDQIHGCKALSQVEIICGECDGPYCVHGKKVTKNNNKTACNCEPGFTGERCDVSLCENYCLHGTCNATGNATELPTCSCPEEYTGQRCNISICENVCIHGKCSVRNKLPKCSCPVGYSGERCEYDPCYKFCLHGKCKNSGGHPNCDCPEEYTGQRCNISICENVCIHGKCSVRNKLPKCSCPVGYSGERCEYDPCYKFCLHGKCNNSGGHPNCDCPEEYTGERCNISICENVCMHGKCSVRNKLPKCSCPVGYSGERCEYDPCYKFCLHGKCKNSGGHPNCDCPEEYTGQRCNISICENVCMHGKCSVRNKLPKCSCPEGYTGQRCEIYMCENFCEHGKCRIQHGLPNCTCSREYTGKRCDIDKCDNFCVRGTCNNNGGHPNCSCGPGFSGVKCQKSICENYCVHGNCCANETGHPECSCDSGYTGLRCEVNKCADHCLNNGECVLTVDDEPSCKCAGGYQGKRCEAGGNTSNGTVSILLNQGEHSTNCSCVCTNQTCLVGPD